MRHRTLGFAQAQVFPKARSMHNLPHTHTLRCELRTKHSLRNTRPPTHTTHNAFLGIIICSNGWHSHQAARSAAWWLCQPLEQITILRKALRLTISPLSANSRICASCAKSSSSMVTNDCAGAVRGHRNQCWKPHPRIGGTGRQSGHGQCGAWRKREPRTAARAPLGCERQTRSPNASPQQTATHIRSVGQPLRLQAKRVGCELGSRKALLSPSVGSRCQAVKLRLKWLRIIVICCNGRAHLSMDLHAWAQAFTSRHNKILRRTSLVQVPSDPLGLPECLAEVVHCAVPLSYDTHRVDPRLLIMESKPGLQTTLCVLFVALGACGQLIVIFDLCAATFLCLRLLLLGVPLPLWKAFLWPTIDYRRLFIHWVPLAEARVRQRGLP
jgi:hypothetical protein